MIKLLDGLSMISCVSPGRVIEPTAKFLVEISIVAKAVGVCDLADGLFCSQKRTAF
jgi:hypothetical protein